MILGEFPMPRVIWKILHKMDFSELLNFILFILQLQQPPQPKRGEENSSHSRHTHFLHSFSSRTNFCYITCLGCTRDKLTRKQRRERSGWKTERRKRTLSEHVSNIFILLLHYTLNNCFSGNMKQKMISQHVFKTFWFVLFCSFCALSFSFDIPLIKSLPAINKLQSSTNDWKKKKKKKISWQLILFCWN